MGLEPTTFSLARRSWVRPFLDEVTEQLALRLMVLVSDQQRVLSLASLAAAKGVDPLDQMRHRDAVRMLRSDVPSFETYLLDPAKNDPSVRVRHRL